eukprot:jgi/Mesen1/3490/ME000197S02513
MVQALARLVHSVQVPEASEESLAAVAGMFSSKAKGIEWTMDFNVAGDPVVVASEAHAITLAVEGLLGVIFTIAILTDEAVEEGELESPRMEMLHHSRPPPLEGQERPGGGGEERGGGIADMCARMVSSVWRTLLEALSVMLSRSQGEAVVLEILKGYQALTTACGVLRMVEPRDAFLESLCSFTLVAPLDVPRPSGALAVLTAGMKRLDVTAAAAAEGQQQQQQQQLRGGSGEGVVLTPKNVQALRTLFNISHRLCTVLGPSWEMVSSLARARVHMRAMRLCSPAGLRAGGEGREEKVGKCENRASGSGQGEIVEREKPGELKKSLGFDQKGRDREKGKTTRADLSAVLQRSGPGTRPDVNLECFHCPDTIASGCSPWQVINTLAAVDRTIHSPHATTQVRTAPYKRSLLPARCLCCVRYQGMWACM